MLVHLSGFFCCCCHLHFHFLSACRPDGAHSPPVCEWRARSACFRCTAMPLFMESERVLSEPGHGQRRSIACDGTLQIYKNITTWNCVCAPRRLHERKRIPLIYEIHDNALMFTVCSTFYAQRTTRQKEIHSDLWAHAHYPARRWPIAILFAGQKHDMPFYESSPYAIRRHKQRN